MKLEVRESIGRFKYVALDKIKAEYDNILMRLQKEVDNLLQKEEA